MQVALDAVRIHGGYGYRARRPMVSRLVDGIRRPAERAS
jgi:alkylation response protein AidB-like acyl-CoA dehydrogenase